MAWSILIVSAEGEEHFAELLASPLRTQGYVVETSGSLSIGDSFVQHVKNKIAEGSAVVLCATVKAIGTGWPNRIVNAIQGRTDRFLYIVQMEREAFVDGISMGCRFAKYWENSSEATTSLLRAIQERYPLDADSTRFAINRDAEERYRQLSLKHFDIINLANLPEMDRHVATRQFELRRLYVSLRVKVEVLIGAELSRDDLLNIEKRRMPDRTNFRQSKISQEVKDESDIWPLGHRLEKTRRIVILGDPGAGKTTLLRWIATAYLLKLNQDQDWKDLPDVGTLPNKPWLPILIRCRDLDTSSSAFSFDSILITTLVKTELNEIEVGALRQLIRDRMSNGEALLLIDGLDEITDLGVRRRFCDQIESIHKAFPLATMVVTSRIVGYKEMGFRFCSEFEHVTIADFSAEDKDEFARRWCSITEEPSRVSIATQELIHDIHCTDRVERLTVNPMLLTTMALVKRKVGRLPSRRADLYWDAFKVLLNWRREVDEPIDEREAIPQLEYVAYVMCDRGVQRLREDEIIDLFSRMRLEYPQIHAVRKHTPEDFLRILERRTGILIESGFEKHLGRPVSLYEFRHLTFQEFIAGRALVEGRFPGRVRSKSLAEYVGPLAGRLTEGDQHAFDNISDPLTSENWRESIRLCVSSCSDDDVDEVLTAILTPCDSEESAKVSRPRAVLAALCLADEPNATDAMVDLIIAKLIDLIGIRDGTFGLASGVDVAINEIAHSRWSRSLLDSLYLKFRVSSGWMKERIAVYLGLNFCVSLPSRIPHDEFKCWVESGFLSNNDSSIPSMFMLASGFIFSSYYGQIDAKLSFDVPKNLSDVTPSLRFDKDLNFAISWAMRQLANLHLGPRTSSVGDPIFSSEWFCSLVTYLESPGVDVDSAVNWIYVAGQCRLGFLTSFFLDCLSHSDGRIQDAAIVSVGRMQDARAVNLLVDILDSNQGRKRKLSITALGEIGKGVPVDIFHRALNGPDVSTCRAAINALVKCRSSVSVPFLLGASSKNKFVEREVAYAVGLLSDAQTIDSVVDFYSSPTDQTRIAVRNGLFAQASDSIAANDLSSTYRCIKAICSLARPEVGDYISWIFCNILLGDLDEARVTSDLVNSMISVEHDSWPLHTHNLGILSYLLGDRDASERYFRQSLEWWTLNPAENPSHVTSVLMLQRFAGVTHSESLAIDVASLRCLEVLDLTRDGNS